MEQINADQQEGWADGLGDPEADIALVALFLASDHARYLTGNTLLVDGGNQSSGVSWNPELPEGPPEP